MVLSHTVLLIALVVIATSKLNNVLCFYSCLPLVKKPTTQVRAASKISAGWCGEPLGSITANFTPRVSINYFSEDL